MYEVFRKRSPDPTTMPAWGNLPSDEREPWEAIAAMTKPAKLPDDADPDATATLAVAANVMANVIDQLKALPRESQVRVLSCVCAFQGISADVTKRIEDGIDKGGATLCDKPPRRTGGASSSCPLDTDGDGNCPAHPTGCPT